MRILPFKIAFTLLFAVVTTVSAQKKSYKEEFKVKPDVVIDVNTRYTDIEIETWNRNEVVVEATMTLEGKDITQEMRDNYFNKWQFEAMGNTSKVNVKSRTNSYINLESFDFDRPNYDVVLNGVKIPDVSIASLEVLNGMNFEIPEVPEIPEIPEIVLPDLPPLPPMPTEFDFDAYKKDKSYLERWKKENKDVLGNNPKVSVREKSIVIKSDTKNGFYNWNYSNEDEEKYEELRQRLEEKQKARKKANQERKKALEQSREARLQAIKVRKEAQKTRNEARKLALVARQEAQNARRKEMQRLLKNRTNIKVKRVVKIKAPKGAKFNMNVKYGSMSFPK